MKKTLFGLGLLVALASCKTQVQVAQVQPRQNKSITSEIPEDAEFVKIIAPYKQKMEATMNTKVSHTSVDLNKNGDNSNLGNLLADFTFDGAAEYASRHSLPGIDAAVINIGGIRSTIGAGDILTKHVFEVMPFENEVIIVKMKGKDLQGLFDYYAATQKNNPVSHLYIETENGKAIKTLVNDKNVDPAKDYYIATSDYLALGGDNMNFFGKGEMIPTGLKLRDLFMEYFRRNPEVKANTDIRLKFNGKK